jgi:hypothetical protein
MFHEIMERTWPAGKRSPISDVEAGAQAASPTPTPRRTANSSVKFRARPEAAVSKLHTVTPAKRIQRRETLSVRRPRGTPTAAYKRVNAVPSDPSTVSLSFHSSRTVSPTAPRIAGRRNSVLMATGMSKANQTVLRLAAWKVLSEKGRANDRPVAYNLNWHDCNF